MPAKFAARSRSIKFKNSTKFTESWFAGFSLGFVVGAQARAHLGGIRRIRQIVPICGLFFPSQSRSGRSLCTPLPEGSREVTPPPPLPLPPPLLPFVGTGDFRPTSRTITLNKCLGNTKTGRRVERLGAPLSSAACQCTNRTWVFVSPSPLQLLAPL